MKITVLTSQHGLSLTLAGNGQTQAEWLDQCLDVVGVGSKRQVVDDLLAQRPNAARTLEGQRARLDIEVDVIDMVITGPATNVGTRRCTAGMR